MAVADYVIAKWIPAARLVVRLICIAMRAAVRIGYFSGGEKRAAVFSVISVGGALTGGSRSRWFWWMLRGL